MTIVYRQWKPVEGANEEYSRYCSVLVKHSDNTTSIPIDFMIRDKDEFIYLVNRLKRNKKKYFYEYYEDTKKIEYRFKPK